LLFHKVSNIPVKNTQIWIQPYHTKAKITIAEFYEFLKLFWVAGPCRAIIGESDVGREFIECITSPSHAVHLLRSVFRRPYQRNEEWSGCGVVKQPAPGEPWKKRATVQIRGTRIRNVALCAEVRTRIQPFFFSFFSFCFLIHWSCFVAGTTT
jgi:hypothetical protein